MVIVRAEPVVVAALTATMALLCPAVELQFKESRRSPTICPFSRNSRIPAHFHPYPPFIPPFRSVDQNQQVPRPRLHQFTPFPVQRAVADHPQSHHHLQSPVVTSANCHWIETASASRNSASNQNLEKYGHHHLAFGQHRSPMTAVHHAAREASANIQRLTLPICCPDPHHRPSPAAAGLTEANQRDRE